MTVDQHTEMPPHRTSFSPKTQNAVLEMPSRTAFLHLTCDLVQCDRLSLEPLLARSQPAQRTRRGAQSAIAAEKALDGDGGRLEVVGIYVNVCAAALEAFPLGHLPNRQNGSVDCAALPIKALDGPHDIFVVDLEPAARFVQRFVIQLVALTSVFFSSAMGASFRRALLFFETNTNRLMPW